MDSSSSTAAAAHHGNNYQFNPSKFLRSTSSKAMRSSDEAIEDLNRMYKSIGLVEHDDESDELNQQRFSSSSSFANCPPNYSDR